MESTTASSGACCSDPVTLPSRTTTTGDGDGSVAGCTAVAAPPIRMSSRLAAWRRMAGCYTRGYRRATRRTDPHHRQLPLAVRPQGAGPVSYTHLRAHETPE